MCVVFDVGCFQLASGHTCHELFALRMGKIGRIPDLVVWPGNAAARMSSTLYVLLQYNIVLFKVRPNQAESIHVVVGSSPTRCSSFFLGKVTTLGVLCCFALFVCLTLPASFFLPTHLSLTTCIGDCCW